jgi:DNA helicase-2/ATP-dependent DNA helicase PcrA
VSTDFLDGLDPEQREVAECLRGPVSVLAGAGTGKTRTLTHRIAHGVRVGAYAPERVLAVTFTRKAAGELQTRLRHLGADGVRAQTFHGAALAQLSFFWPQVIGGSAPKVIGGKIAVVSQAVEALGMRLPAETLRDIAAEIEWRKVSMLGFDSYAARLASVTDSRPVPTGVTVEQLLDVQKRYESLLADRKQIDFEDVLILTTGMLETEPRAAVQVREQYRFFTVDEFQDVSPLQHGLLNVWLGNREDLCVVGDASQTIYSFAGASSSYLLRFQSEYPNARTFRLERNYRSDEPIVRVANRLMQNQPGALTLKAERSAMTTHTVAESRVLAEWFATEHDEAEAVAEAIRGSIASGTPASEIAVLYRANAQAASIESALQRRGVSARVQGAQRFFDRAEVRQAVMLMRGQAKAFDARPLFQVVSDVLRACGWTTDPPEGSAARDRWDALNAILGMVDEQPPDTQMSAFSEELVKRSKAQHEPTVEAVTLSAIHSAKGLEWKLVHLIGMSEGLLPSTYAEDDEAIAEERRLTYVALTRARDELRISGSAGNARNPRSPSRFIAEAGLRFGA